MTKTDYGSVLLDERSGEYWQLNATGTAVAVGLLEGLSTAGISELLVAEYEVDLTQVTTDVSMVMEELHAAGLLLPKSRS